MILTSGVNMRIGRPGQVLGRGRRVPSFDPDALAYITAVETADGEALEAGVKAAINDFVTGCKADGIWDAIKASCILAGARTLNGCLVPLNGSAPTNINFVSDDYSRITGLKGDGSTKYLDTNRAHHDDPKDNNHFSVFLTAGDASTSACIGTRIVDNQHSGFVHSSGDRFFFPSTTNSGARIIFSGGASAIGFAGCSRTSGTSATARSDGANQTSNSTTALDHLATNFAVFAREGDTPSVLSASRLSFYSIGEAVDLAALDARVSALMTAIDGAIT